eukprot:3843714-Prymnesium_polylepis.1
MGHRAFLRAGSKVPGHFEVEPRKNKRHPSEVFSRLSPAFAHLSPWDEMALTQPRVAAGAAHDQMDQAGIMSAGQDTGAYVKWALLLQDQLEKTQNERVRARAGAEKATRTQHKSHPSGWANGASCVRL